MSKMDKLNLYEAALSKLAMEGNEQAKIVLELANSFKKEAKLDKASVIKHLTNAIMSNGDGWCTETDKEIQKAIDLIMACD